MKRLTRGAVLAAVLFLTGKTAAAQAWVDGPPPQHRFFHRSLLAVRVNPLGLFYDGRFGYRLRLYRSEKTALRDNHLGIGLAPVVSPAFMRVGPFIEFTPATFLTLWGTVTFVQYFGTFDLAASFPSAGSGLDGQNSFSDATIRTRSQPVGNPVDNYLANGWEVTLGVDLQAKVGPMILRNKMRFVRPEMKLRAGDRIIYDQLYDVAAPNYGWYWTNDLDVLWQGIQNKLVAGARFTATVPFNDARHFEPGEAQEARNAMMRVGPFVGYTFFSRDGAGFNNPTIFLLAQWWLLHRYRAGQEVSQALPLMGVGFQFTGDFVHSTN
jgi:hypothetical protein